MQGEKVREKSGIFEKHEKSGKVREFCCVKLIFSQSERLDFENFLREYALRPPK